MADGYTGLHTRRAVAAKNSLLASAAHVVEHGVTAPAGLVSGLRSFAALHGGATAVIEYAGRKGARIVLMGGDGAKGAEQYAESTEAARLACAQAGVDVEHEWERELTEQMKLSADVWGGRSRRVLSR